MLVLTGKSGFALKHETWSCHCLCNFKSSSQSFPPFLGMSQGFTRRTWQSAVPSAPGCTGTRVKAVQQENLVFLYSSVLWFWNLSNIKIIGLWQMCFGISSLRNTCLILPMPMAATSVSQQCQRKVPFKTSSEHGFVPRGHYIQHLQRSPVGVEQQTM